MFLNHETVLSKGNPMELLRNVNKSFIKYESWFCKYRFNHDILITLCMIKITHHKCIIMRTILHPEIF